VHDHSIAHNQAQPPCDPRSCGQLRLPFQSLRFWYVGAQNCSSPASYSATSVVQTPAWYYSDGKFNDEQLLVSSSHGLPQDDEVNRRNDISEAKTRSYSVRWSSYSCINRFTRSGVHPNQIVTCIAVQALNRNSYFWAIKADADVLRLLL
jgi:hypothetical protein